MNFMKPALLVLFSLSSLFAASPKPYFSQPAISPDASEIAFVSGGDIWTVPARGGVARLLVSHPATESAPHYSPDGKYLAFSSTRTGGGDVYLLTLATGELTRLTFDDAGESVEGWSPDSGWIYFASNARDVANLSDVYRVSREGGTPMQVTADRYASEYFSAPAPDGTTLAFTALGMAGSQWWRKGHAHIDQSEIWLRKEGTPAVYQQVTSGDAKEAWPMWTRDGKTLYYMSDRSGAQNIWRKPVNGGAAAQITKFTNGRVIWPSISADGRAIVFERDFGIWKLDLETGKAAAVEIERRGSPAGTDVRHVSLAGQFRELALSPDGKKVAFVAHGEIFAASAKDGGDAQRITHTPAPESQPVWAPDSKRLAYVSTRDGASHLYLYDFGTSQETRLTDGAFDYNPKFSPDGKLVAFYREGRELLVLDLASKQERTLATGHFDLPPIGGNHNLVWSPDGKWLAFFNETGKAFVNAWVVPAAGGPSQAASFLGNTNADELTWSPDGKYLLFVTDQRTEQSQIARVDLIPRTPRFHEDEFRDLFKEASAKPAGKPDAAPAKPPTPDVKVSFEGIRDRLSLLPVGLAVESVTISPDGKTAVLVATAAGQQNLYSYSLDELAKEAPVARQLTSTSSRKSDVQFTPDSKSVFYLDRGNITSLPLETRQAKPLAVTAEMDVDFSREKLEIFHQAWGYIRDQFFDPKFNGVDWDAVRTTYEPLFAGAATTDEMRELLNLMVGELNASHLGAGAGGGPGQASETGRLGLRFDRAEYESAGKLKVTEVIRLSPADVAGIKVGAYLEAVDGTAIGAHTNLEELLDHKIGKRVVLKVSGKDVPVQPVNLATVRNLLYRQWVEDNRAYVAKISGGKLGYVHMADMSENALNRLHLDLDSENQGRQGVVIDIRNNNGGFVNAYALDVFTRRPYLRMTERGKPEAPARTVLGQRALEAPTILVTNRESLSDAEDFTEGYRVLKLGKVVGEPTAGWIIYTWGTQLLDGTSFRLPHTRIRGVDGDDMELHPRAVDVPVSRPVGESFAGKDSQLDAAVRELLRSL
jgi:tricorn protease